MTGEKHASAGNDSIQEWGLLSLLLLIYRSINDAAYTRANRSIKSYQEYVYIYIFC